MESNGDSVQNYSSVTDENRNDSDDITTDSIADLGSPGRAPMPESETADEDLTSNIKERQTAIFGPINNATVDQFAEYFKSRGTDFVELNLLSNYGVISFNTKTEVTKFISMYDNSVFNGQTLWANLPKEQKDQNVTKTLIVYGLDRINMSQRDLFNLLAPKSFVRRISMNKQGTSIELDTPHDAEEAFKLLKELEMKNSFVHVAYDNENSGPDPTTQIIPLESILPPTHPFWAKLQRMLFD